MASRAVFRSSAYQRLRASLDIPTIGASSGLPGCRKFTSRRASLLKHREPALVADLGPALAEPKVLIDRRKLLDHLNDLGDLIGTELDRRQLFQTSHIRLLRGSESLTAFGRESLR